MRSAPSGGIPGRVQVQGMDDNNARLRATLKASEAKEANVRGELADLKGLLRRQARESEALRVEVSKLKRMLKVCSP